MIDFTELPKDGILFEQLVRELFVKKGYETYWSGVGIDGGRDLIVFEDLRGPLSCRKRKWLVSCKHNAHSRKSVSVQELGDFSAACAAIDAEGFILACSTYASSSVVRRIEETSTSKGIAYHIWDGVEIERQLNQPESFSLIHRFFPQSSNANPWKVYNAYSPSYWAAHYKDHFFYLSSSNATTFPNLKDAEHIVTSFEAVQIFKGERFESHYLKLRAIHYNDKFCVHTAYLDYLFSEKTQGHLLTASELQNQLNASFGKLPNIHMNEPDWDVRYVSVNTDSDNFEFNHKDFYEPYVKNYETGRSRSRLLHQEAEIESFYKKNDIRVHTADSIQEFLEKIKNLRR